MSKSPVEPGPNNGDFEYEQVLYFDDGGDTTVRPVNPTSMKIRERDREQISALLAWAKQQQQQLDAGSRRSNSDDLDRV